MAGFTIYPAIDLHQGKVVRLAQGDLTRQTIYADNPSEMARRWMGAGAIWLHVVNLDGAFEQPDQDNRRGLKDILAAAEDFTPARKIQFGGGLRSLQAIELALESGVERVVLGTAGVQSPELVEKAVKAFGAERMAVGLDGREGQVRLRGWTEGAGLSVVEAAKRLGMAGVETILFTDIARDGMGSGLNLAATQALKDASGLNIIASGGVGGLEDIRQAKLCGLAGVVIGRALYEGAIRLEEALEIERS